MTTLRIALLILPLALAACDQTPSQTGASVGHWLNHASTQTGRAVGDAGDQTGRALQNAGSGLRNTFSPAPTPPQPNYGY